MLRLGSDSKAQPLSKANLKTLINGKTWVPKTSIALKDQFFLKEMDLNGRLIFKGNQFDNVQFTYDLSTEEIITRIETIDKTKRNIIVNANFLEGFSINDNQFKFDFIRGDLLHTKLDSNNYYQVVKFKNLKYVIKRKMKKILKSHNSKKFKYTPENKVYIISGNEIISIKTKNDILHFFPLEKKKMKQYIRTHKLKIGTKTPMDAIVLLSKFDL